MSQVEMDELTELKCELKSLVVSSPVQMDARSLARDYRALVGASLADVAARFGAADPVQLLRERCADCFLLRGDPRNPVLTLLVDDSLRHIDQLVQRQRSAHSRQGRRRSVPAPRAPPPPPAPRAPPPPPAPRAPAPAPAPPRALPVSPAPHRAHRAPPFHVIAEARKSQPSASVRPLDAGGGDEGAAGGKHGASSEDGAGSGGSGGSSGRRAALDVVRAEVLELLQERGAGVWCADLLREYRGRYGRELDLRRAGCSSIAALVSGLGDAVRVTQGARDALLTHAACPAPPAPADPARALRRAPPRALHRDQPSEDDALPGVPFDSSVFPSDCMYWLESIPPAPLDVWPGAQLPVVVGEVYSPSHFWLLRLGEGYSDDMDRVMGEMNQYYGACEGGAGRKLCAGAARVGLYCACLYAGEWHRAVVVREMDAGTVKVRHVDYGTVETVQVDALKPLLRRWSTLPAQAVRARLAAVRPPHSARRWQHAAARAFLALVRDKRLAAEVVSVDAEEREVEVYLADTAGASDVFVHEQLVEGGHADPRHDCALTTGARDPHLLPSFAALEAGATPNFADIANYLKHGIVLDFVEEYRAHVSPALPPPAAPPLLSLPERRVLHSLRAWDPLAASSFERTADIRARHAAAAAAASNALRLM